MVPWRVRPPTVVASRALTDLKMTQTSIVAELITIRLITAVDRCSARRRHWREATLIIRQAHWHVPCRLAGHPFTAL